MSKDQKKKLSIPVETVDNWKKTLDYIITTLGFWHLDEKWPGNLCSDGLNNINYEMKQFLDNYEIPF